MSQTDYNQQARAFNGLLADLGYVDILSRANEESSNVPFGVAVKSGSADDKFLLPVAAGDKVLGITVHSHALDNREVTTDQDVPTQRVASILRSGRVFVNPEVAVSENDPVYVRFADGVADVTRTQKGSLTNIDDSGTAFLLKGARWAKDGAQDTPTEVELKGQLGESSAEQFRIDVAQVTADTTLFLFEAHSGRAFLVEEVVYYNATGLAADAANYFNIKVQHGGGPTVVANWSTETGQEGTIAADTPVRLTLGSNVIIPPDTRVNLFLDETGTATLPAGVLQVIGRYL